MKREVTGTPQPKRHLLNFTLSGLPELEYFDSVERRQAALNEIGHEVAELRSGNYWFAVVVLVGSVLVGQYLVRRLLRLIPWPTWLEDVLLLLLTGGVFFLTLRHLHRSGAAVELRHKLLCDGVPICTHCGYLLRGLPLEPGRCPECGKAFDERVRGILGSAEKTSA